MKTNKILMSFHGNSLAQILNGEKDIDIRRMFPWNFKGWVYCYLTQAGGSNALFKFSDDSETKAFYRTGTDLFEYSGLNGKVLCRFYVRKVESIYSVQRRTKSLTREELIKRSGMSDKTMEAYISGHGRDMAFNPKAIYISNLEVFKTPMKLEQFKAAGSNAGSNNTVTKAPNKMIYVQTDELIESESEAVERKAPEERCLNCYLTELNKTLAAFNVDTNGRIPTYDIWDAACQAELQGKVLKIVLADKE